MRLRPIWFLSAFVAAALAIPAWPLWRHLTVSTAQSQLNWRSKPELRTAMGDHFAGRDTIAAANAHFATATLGVSLFPQVAVGRTGWLFFIPNEMDAVRAWPPPSPQRLAAIRAWFDGNRAHAEAHGARYLVAILPCKASTYPDELPTWCVPAKQSVTDLVLADLRAHLPGLEVLDLRPAVLAARLAVEADPAAPVRRVFQQFDTHWNDLGALAAANGLLGYLAATYPAIRPPQLTDYRITVETHATGDLARLLGLPGAKPEDLPQLVHADGTPLNRYPEDRIGPGTLLGNPQGEAGLPRALLLRDSFAQRQLPFLAPSFSELHCVWIPGHPYGAAQVEAVRPQMVIHQLNERQFTDRAFLLQLAETLGDRQDRGSSRSK
jgi:hypothetical protein